MQQTHLVQSGALRAGVVVVCFLVIVAGSWRLCAYERPGNTTALDELVPVMVSGNPNSSIVMDYWIFLNVRYWVEYSGEFDQWRQAWIDRGVISTYGFVRATPKPIKDFLGSSSDRMLFKDIDALEQLTNPPPPNIKAIYPSDPGLASSGLSSSPVVLVKTSSSRSSDS